VRNHILFAADSGDAIWWHWMQSDIVIDISVQQDVAFEEVVWVRVLVIGHQLVEDGLRQQLTAQNRLGRHIHLRIFLKLNICVIHKPHSHRATPVRINSRNLVVAFEDCIAGKH